MAHDELIARLERACEAWHNADLESSRAWTPWAECLAEYKEHVRTCIAAALRAASDQVRG